MRERGREREWVSDFLPLSCIFQALSLCCEVLRNHLSGHPSVRISRTGTAGARGRGMDTGNLCRMPRSLGPGLRLRRRMVSGSFITRKKKWATGVVAPPNDVDSSSVPPASATKVHRTFLGVVLGICGSQPPASKHSEPERQKTVETASQLDKLEQLFAIMM